MRLSRATQTLFWMACLILGLSACMSDTSASAIAPAAAASTLRPTKAADIELIVLGMGCFWGAEKRMSALAGVFDVESGYANGSVATTYEAVLAQERALKSGGGSGKNHSEVVKVSFEKFKHDVLDHWKSPVAVARSMSSRVPEGWSLEKDLFATPTIVLFEQGKEVSRFTGYNGEQGRFWKWLGTRLLSPEQQQIAFEQGTEWPFTGSNLDEKRTGTFVDPVTGAALFRSDSKFESGTGWPSFFMPMKGAVTLHEDPSEGMKRVEVRSASSGIHLGHVFDDGPAPTHKRYCINGNVLKFIPDSGT